MDQEKVFCRGSEGKEAFLDHKNISLKNHQNLLFSKRLVHGFCPNWRFFYILFLHKIDQEKQFCEVIEGKDAFLYYKNIALKNPQICLFQKGLVHSFCQKMDIFLILCFYAKWIKKNRFCEVFERKESSLDYKNIGSKNPSFAFFLMG